MCRSIWPGVGIKNSKLHRINVLHNNIVRLMILSNMPGETRLSNDSIFKSLNLLKFKDIYRLELGKFMHKAYYNSLPECLNNMFNRISNIHRYPTSSSRSRVFYQEISITATHRNWISSAGISLWETVPCSLRDQTYFTFSKAYRRFIIDNY